MAVLIELEPPRTTAARAGSSPPWARGSAGSSPPWARGSPCGAGASNHPSLCRGVARL